MAHVAVKEVTHPVHAPDGHSLAFAPGEQFPEGHELPHGVPWRWVVVEVPDEPVPEPKPAPAPEPAVKAAGRPHAGKVP